AGIGAEADSGPEITAPICRLRRRRSGPPPRAHGCRCTCPIHPARYGIESFADDGGHDGHPGGLVDDLFAVLVVLNLQAGVHLLLDVVLVLVLLVLGTLAAARTGTAHHAAHAAAHTGTGTGLRRSGSAGARPAAERNSTGALPRTEAARTSCCTTTNWTEARGSTAPGARA